MKKIILAFLAAACLLGSCSKDNSSDEQPGQSQISITGGGVITAGPDGAEQAITVTSMGDWRLAGSSDWAHPSATSGKSGDVVTFTVDPNTEDVAREATFKFFTGSSIAVLKITSEIGYKLEMLSDPEFSYNKEAQILSVKLKTNIPELTSACSDGGEEWIKFDSRSDGFGTTVLTFNVSANEAYEGRSSVVTIGGQGVEPITVKVNQTQTDVILPEKMSYVFDLKAGQVAIKLETNIAYTVEVPAKYSTWLHHQTAAPSPSVLAMTEATETFTLDAATGLRGGKIIFKAKDSSYSITVNIVQSGETHVYATIPDLKFQTWLENNDYIVVVDGAKCELTGLAADVITFDCRNSGIASFEGIEAFTKLTSLQCTKNPITLLPLKDLDITMLDLSNGSVSNLVISSSKLTQLKINNNTYSLNTLDVSGCPVLADLDISNNYYMATLYIKAGQMFTKLTDKYAGWYTDNDKYATVER